MTGAKDIPAAPASMSRRVSMVVLPYVLQSMSARRGMAVKAAKQPSTVAE
jgi:hypothetical protein